MDSSPAALIAVLQEGIAVLDERGGLLAGNVAMTEMLALAGTQAPARDLGALGVDALSEARLRSGECVTVDVVGRCFALRCAREGAMCWLVAHEITAHERALSAVVELVRLRAMAGGVATLVHEFNNMMNACLGLAAHVRPHLRDPLDVRVLQDLSLGTQQGAHLARTIVRLLTRSIGERAVVPLSAILDEAMTVTAKAASQRGIQVVIEKGDASLIVRTVVVEAVQAVWQALMGIVERTPSRILITQAHAEVAIGAQRVRAVASVCMRASGLAHDAMEEIVRVVAGAPGCMAALARSPMASGLAAAVFVQLRLGGDLTARLQGEDLQLELRWPLAC